MTSSVTAATAAAFGGVQRDPSAEIRSSRADEAAKKFEQLLLFELLKTMRKTTLEDQGEGAFAKQTVMGMFDQAIADGAAGSLGVAPMLARQLGGSVPTRPSKETQPGSVLRPAAAPAQHAHHHAHHAGLDHDSPRAHAGVFGASLPKAGELPVHGRESSGFGWRVHPISGDKKFHTGIDIAAPEGTEIRAPAPGKVVFAGRHPGYGNMVEIRHADGAKSRYAHASRLHVSVGDYVDAGEAIADVGSTGQSTGPHLHFEVRNKGRAIDPHRYLDALANEPAVATGRRTGIIDESG